MPFIFSCTPKNAYVINGDYPGAKDGTVVYLSKYMVFDLNEMLTPIDSAIVQNDKFKFKGTADNFEVCLLSSAKIVDGGFIVLENGNIEFTFNGAKSGGTLWNKEVNRFMYEKEKIINIKKMASPAVQKNLLLEPSMLDSINELSEYASKIFDSYATGLIRKNANNRLGHFFLTQAADAITPGKLLPLFPLIPNEYRDKLYDGKKAILEAELQDNLDFVKYAIKAQEAARETSVGKKYINFELDNIIGGKNLFSENVSSSRYTILLFWATWNNNSVDFVKELNNLCQKYGKNEINIVTVSLDDDIKQCSDIVNSFGLTGTHLCSPSQGSAELASAYGIYELPACMIINRNGVIISRTSSINDVKNKLKEILH